MRIEELDLPGPKLITVHPFIDPRGRVAELYRQSRYRDVGIDASFVQDTYAESHRGVLRGLHVRVPHEQAKLVQVLEGRIFDVVVDARPQSPTCGQWCAVTLHPERQLFIPPGFAHGFFALEDSRMLYKLSVEWTAGEDRAIAFDDPALGIDWPAEAPTLSARDRRAPSFAEYLASLP